MIKFFLAGFVCFFGICFAEDGLDLQAIIRKIETQYQGETSQAKARMFIRRKTWSRELVMNSYSEGRNHFLTVVQEPLREKGMATLKMDNDMWSYNPKIDRLIKIPSSLMGDGWMGSHFTNDDLVKGDKIDELYSFSLLSEDEEKWVIRALPRENAAVVWGEIHYTVNRQWEIPMQAAYYDEEGILVRTMFFDQVEELAGRHIPLRMTMQPVENPDEQTVVVYEKLEFDVKLERDLFSVRNLKRGRF